MAFTLAITIFPGAEDAALVAVGRFVPVFFEVITGGWLLVKGVRVPATVEPAGVRGRAPGPPS